jgi:NADH:ubiquinone oxidoreductase subunit 2 (subunit N)
MTEYSRTKIVFFAQSCCLIFIGLWDLFAIGLPPIDKVGMIEIFPRVFPIIIGTLLLFIYPLLSDQDRFWFLATLFLNVSMCFVILRQMFNADGMGLFSLLLLLLVNLSAITFYLIYLRKKKLKEN